MIDVSDFGAIGDGVADDTGAIQKALGLAALPQDERSLDSESGRDPIDAEGK